jgi:cyclopropane fatty-acyl-phospholipid synthase-like methyltransferase
MSKFHEGGVHGIRHDDTPEELARKLYDDPKYFEDNPRGYKNMSLVAKRSQWHDEVVAKFTAAHPVRGLRMLDVGCATGVFMRPFLEAGADVMGIELSAHASRVAAEVIDARFPLQGRSRVVHGSAHDLSAFVDGAFDLYWSVEVIEHVPYRYHLAMLREARRVLRPGGVAYLQGQIGVKDYLVPNHDDDSGHIAVFPEGYWLDMVRHAGFSLDAGDSTLMAAWAPLRDDDRWKSQGWRYVLARRP